MTALFLTPDELQELTGYRAFRAQVRWLEKNRWRFALTRHAQPKVARDYFNERVGPGVASPFNQVNQAAALEQPDFSALDRR